jgi:coproporphyrinogen III oxidase
MKSATGLTRASIRSSARHATTISTITTGRRPEVIGGIFFDRLRNDGSHNPEYWFDFVSACGNSFIESYLPIVQKRKQMAWTEAHKFWQEIRRGRYVEFNLLHDKGTMFGLKTNGRMESILMSLPPTVRWEYNYQPDPGSEEARLLEVLKHPKSDFF